MGRPSSFSQEIADTICERLADGESLRSICQDDGMPNKATVFRWLASKELSNFRDQYALAREAQADTFVDEMVDIADDGSNDWMERKRRDGSLETVFNREHVDRSKLRADVRKWVAVKLLPKKYGIVRENEPEDDRDKGTLRIVIENDPDAGRES